MHPEAAEMGEQAQPPGQPDTRYGVLRQAALASQMPQIAVQQCLELRRQLLLGHLTTRW